MDKAIISAIEILATELGAALKARGFMLTLAESCTGGMLSQAITSVAGSSAWFDRGFITYSNQAKIEMLDVSSHTLEIFGAVSEEIAREMVLGALKHSHAHIAASITGIAGPDGGSTQKPVGTVCFGFVLNKNSHTATQHFAGNRETIRQKSVEYALKQLLALTLKAEI